MLKTIILLGTGLLLFPYNGTALEQEKIDQLTSLDVLGAQFDMVRSKAKENRHKLSPILYDTLVELDLMPYREMETPEALREALSGVD